VVPPALTYRRRLRVEGLALAACGVAGSVALVLADGRTTDHAVSTLVQLAVVVVLLATLGPRSVARAIAAARPDGEPAPATGEPTPLWHLPLVVAVLATPLVLLGSWDAGLRVTAGCALVGLAQAGLLAARVAADEQRTGRTYARAPGSRILRGTRLAYVDDALQQPGR
jgi:hypothetical protein